MSRNPGRLARLGESLRRGVFSGFNTTWILVKVMVPTMAAVHLLKTVGLLRLLDRGMSPLMGIFGLPGEASLVLVTGGLVNVYSAIAVAVNIPLTPGEMTVLGIMVLIAHNLIVETAVQSRAGTPAAIMLTARIGAAVTAGLFFSRVVASGGPGVVRAGWQSTEETWVGTLVGNGASLAKISLIIIGLMVLVECMREFGIMDWITRLLEFPMRVLGMDRSSAFVAAVGLLLGLAYGAGLIIEETDRSRIGKKEILATNLFLGTNHALIEDSLIFAAVGAHLGWIILGRLLFGVVFLKAATPAALFLLNTLAGEKNPARAAAPEKRL